MTRTTRITTRITRIISNSNSTLKKDICCNENIDIMILYDIV